MTRLTAFASDLGLSPVNPFPTTLTTDLGNGQPFVLAKLSEDCSTAQYRQAFGNLTLSIFND
jgi:hypothetical protein